MRRHNHLTDDVFKNSKYIFTINKITGYKDIRKENNEQYRLILDIFQTFILIFNCFFSDSNKSKADKADDARTIIEKLIYRDYENSQKHKYSVRDIKDIVDKRARRFYNYMEQWQKDLMNITPKNANSSIELKNIMEILEKEMNELEYVEFDSVVSENILYQRNTIKNYKSYTKYICKFDSIYIKNNEFKDEFKNNFYDNNGIKLDDNDLNKLGLLFKLLSSLNNGIINIIADYKITDEISKGTTPDELYKIYLKSCNIDYDNDNFLCNSNDFLVFMGIIKNKVDEELKYDNKILLERFDLLFFYLTMEQCFYSHKIKVKSNYINKLLNDLIDIYKQFKEIKNDEKNLSLDELKEKYFIPLYAKTSEMIKRYGDVYERIS